jgi:hypothetical protein
MATNLAVVYMLRSWIVNSPLRAPEGLPLTEALMPQFDLTLTVVRSTYYIRPLLNLTIA